MKDLVHRCRQGRRCKARERDDAGEFHGAGVERPDSLCRPCEESAFVDIRKLGDDYEMLKSARTQIRTAASGPKVSGSSERPIPIPLAVDTLMSDIDLEVTRWALRITKGDPLPPNATSQVLACVTILCSSLGTLVDMPTQVVAAYFPYPDGGDWDGRMELDGVDAVLRLSMLHHRAVNVLGLDESKYEWLREPCHVCGRKAVVASLEEDKLVKCRGCGNVWHQDEFARLNNVLAAA